MATENETAQPTADAPSTLEIATNVLVRMAGHGKANARRFLGRCTKEEISQLAACHCKELDVNAKVGEKFKQTFGEIMDAILARQEAEEPKEKAAGQ